MLFFYFKQLSVCSLLTASFLFHLCLPWMQRLVCQYTVIAEASATKVWPIAQTPPPSPSGVCKMPVYNVALSKHKCVLYIERPCVVYLYCSALTGLFFPDAGPVHSTPNRCRAAQGPPTYYRKGHRRPSCMREPGVACMADTFQYRRLTLITAQAL